MFSVRTSISRESRVWIAFAGATVMAGFLFSVTYPVSGVHSLSSILWSMAVLVPWAGTVVIGIGGPLYLLCERYALVQWWSSLLGGALGGSLFSFLLALPNAPPREHLVVSLLVGLAAGVVFWLLYPSGRKVEDRVRAHEA